MHVFYLTKDLLFSSRVASLAREAGTSLEVGPTLDASRIRDDTALVIIDLSVPQLDIDAAVQQLRGSREDVKILAYGPHVDTVALTRARRAGCDCVLPRSQFDQQVAAIIRNPTSLPTTSPPPAER